jgi:hypothetical protein
MGINNAKHIIAEIDGTRCTIVETGASPERVAFLKQLLEFNNYEVREQQVTPQTPESEPSFTVGVTDVVFNPAFAIYDFSLKTPEGGFVTPGYWLQECIECNPSYWLRRQKPRK